MNFFKSNLASVMVESMEMQTFANVLNSGVMGIPFLYLGMSIGANPKRVSTWKPVVDKIRRKRLSSWKQKRLSIGGRICLIKSILTAIPLYYLSFFRAPKKVRN